MASTALASLWATAAHAEPISAAIGLTALIEGIGVSAGIAATIGGTLITGAAYAGLSYLSSKLSPQPALGSAATTTATTGVQSTVTIGGAVPRGAIYGRQATAGQLIYWNTYGDNNEFLQLVYVIGDGLHDSLESMWVNGNAVTFGSVGGAGTAIVEFNDNGNDTMFVRFFNGSDAQTADSELVSHANPTGRWTSDDTLTGVCYASVTLFFDSNVYQSGIPSFLFGVKGLRCYDPRKDSTNGGSGSHRWGTQTTYEWTDNVAICLYNYQRGLYVNNQLVLGEGLAAADIITNMYVSAANVCDEAIPLKAGGTEPAYRVGMTVSADTQLKSVIQDFLTAMAGTLYESAGAFGPYAGAAVVPLPGITDDDLVVGQPIKYAKFRSRSELINAVFGNYSEPSQSWKMVSYPPRTSSADELADGERLAVQTDYPMIFSQTQAQRVSEIERQLSRRQSTATIVLPFKFATIEPGDWLPWTSARYGFSITFQVTNTTRGPDDTMTVSLREIDSDVFGWDPDTQELNPLAPGDLPGVGTQLTTVAGLALAPTQIDGANGCTLPALTVTWTPVVDHTITAVILEYRVQAQPGTVKQVRCNSPSGGIYVIQESIQADTIYEVRATIETIPVRTTAFTAWVPETAPPEYIVPSTRDIDPTSGLGDYVKVQLGAFQARLDGIAQLIASIAADQDAANWTDKKQVRQDLVSQTGALSARIDTVETAETSTSAALASFETTVDASLGDHDARITENFTAIATITGKLAAQWTVTLNVDGYVSGLKAYNDGTTSGMTIVGDIFEIAFPGVTGGSPVAVFEVANVSGVAQVVLKGNLLADGTIEARHMTVGTIDASNIIADNIILSGHLVANCATSTNFVAGTSGNYGHVTGETTLATLTTSFNGGHVAIDVSLLYNTGAYTAAFASASSNALSTGIAQIILRMDGTIIASTWLGAWVIAGDGTTGPNWFYRGNGPCCFTAVESSLTGSHTFTVSVNIPNMLTNGGTASDIVSLSNILLRTQEYIR